MSRHVARATLRVMTNLPPPAEELRLLDAELRQLDLRRATLLRRRAWLIHILRSATAQAPGPGSEATPTGGPPSARRSRRGPAS
ncbi:hypothetical protein STENM223S_02104 [Streptomyces tendae]